MIRLALALTCTCVAIASAAIGQTGQPATIRVGRLIDGKGGSQQNVVITLNGSKIASIGKANGPVTYDLSKYTLLPGFIDVHVHPSWHFGPDGRFQQGGTPEERLQGGVDNMKATVMGGFTTVQSVGEAGDITLRKKLQDDNLPGPRIITSAGTINEYSGQQRGQRGGQRQLSTPDQLREAVRNLKANGAELIKL